MSHVISSKAHGEQAGLSVHRTQIGIRPEDLHRLQELIGDASDDDGGLVAKQRGPQPLHDWRAFYIEVARLVYFDGVPPSKNAVVRHLQDWSRQTGRPAPQGAKSWPGARYPRNLHADYAFGEAEECAGRLAHAVGGASPTPRLR